MTFVVKKNAVKTVATRLKILTCYQVFFGKVLVTRFVEAILPIVMQASLWNRDVLEARIFSIHKV